MAKVLTTQQAIASFRFRAAALVQQGKTNELRTLFSKLSAAARMTDGEAALHAMDTELRNTLRRARQNVKTGNFSGP